MSDQVPVTEASLRAAMRDPRYWRRGEPEREAYVGWVTEGWRALEGQGPGGVVQVRAYARTRNGRTEQVAAHTRSDPPGGEGTARPPLLRVQAQMAAPLVLNAPRIAPMIAQGARRLAPGAARLLRPSFPILPRASLLERAEREERLGTLGGRRWYNAIPEQEGEREASAEADAASGERATVAPGEGVDGAETTRPRYRVHDGKQGKHVRGHNNFRPEGSPSEMAPAIEPKRLIDRYAGRGESANGIPAGRAGARERFDTGDEVIGIYRDRSGRSAPTTRGIIHYGSDGTVHVVPARPRGWFEGKS